MATRRIKDITNTATTFASDDFIALDGATQGTRKMDKDDLIAEVSAGVSGDYLEEANNLSDVASLDTSKLNMEIPDVGTAPNEVPLNGMLGDMAFQSSDGVSAGTVEAESLTVDSGGSTQPTQSVVTNDGAEGSALELRNNSITSSTATALRFTNSTAAGSNYGAAKISAVRTDSWFQRQHGHSHQQFDQWFPHRKSPHRLNRAESASGQPRHRRLFTQRPLTQLYGWKTPPLVALPRLRH